MSVKRFRIKPYEIEAILWDGSNHAEIATFTHPILARFHTDDDGITIETLPKPLTAYKGDYIVALPNTRLHVFKARTIEKLYEEVDGND